MAIVKENMVRVSKAGKKAEPSKQAKPAAKQTSSLSKNESDKAEAAATADKASVEAAHIVYQPSAEVLERAAYPNESFGIGDAMPIYYL